MAIFLVNDMLAPTLKSDQLFYVLQLLKTGKKRFPENLFDFQLHPFQIRKKLDFFLRKIVNVNKNNFKYFEALYPVLDSDVQTPPTSKISRKPERCAMFKTCFNFLRALMD